MAMYTFLHPKLFRESIFKRRSKIAKILLEIPAGQIGVLKDCKVIQPCNTSSGSGVPTCISSVLETFFSSITANLL